MPLVSRTFDQLIDFTRTSAATYVDATGKIVPTAASRNLLTFTQEFDNGAWAKTNAAVQANVLLQSQDFQTTWSFGGTVTPDQATAPDGSLTADLVAITGASAVTQSPTLVPSAVYTVSVYLKAATASENVVVRFATISGTAYSARINVSNGTVTNSSTEPFTSTTIAPLGNGWYRFTGTGTAVTSDGRVQIYPNAGVGGFTGGASGNVYLWGAQLVPGTTPGDYQRTTTATVALPYTAPDGTFTADTLVEDTTNGVHQCGRTITTSAVPYTFSCYVKAGTRTFAMLYHTQTNTGVSINLSTGATATPSGLSAPTSSSVTAVGNGWYRLSMTVTATAASNFFGVYVMTSLNTYSYTGDGTSGIYLWGAQLEAVPDANLVLGSELVSNGTFNTDLSGWAVGTDAAQVVPTWSAGSVTLTRGSGGISGFSQGLGLVSGRAYRVSFELISGNVSCGGGLPGFTTVTTLGVNTRVIVANGSNIQFWPTNTSSTAVIDNISVKEITGTTGMPTDYTRNNGGVYPPRFDYDPVTLAPKGLLVEEQRTNLLVRSEEFDTASWTKTATSVTANATTSPDGTVDADKVIEDTAASVHRVVQNATIVSGTVYTLSAFVKAAERTRFVLRLSDGSSTFARGFDLSSQTSFATTSGETAPTSWTLTDAGGGWFRASVTATSAGTIGGGQICLVNAGTNTSYTGDGTSGIFVWGAQLEAGSFATSYIPTVASQVTRTADVATITGANFSQFYNQSEGTWVVELQKLSPSSTATYGVEVTGASSNFSMRVRLGTDARMQSVDGGVAVVDAQLAASVPTTVSKYGIAYKLNDYAGSAGGAAAVTDTSATVPALSALSIGSAGVTNLYVRSIRYYPTRLTNAQLQALTA